MTNSKSIRRPNHALRSNPRAEHYCVIRAWGENAAWVRVSFEDTGVGLTKEDCERVFAPFFTTKEKGLGMGLSISRSLIAAHGGSLWAAPGPGHGTTFHVRLPVARGGQA